MTQYKYQLDEKDIPRQWYNVLADLPSPLAPPIHPATHEPIGPEALAPLFPMALIEQEVCTERFIDIPDEVRGVYKLWRPTMSTSPASWRTTPTRPRRSNRRWPGSPR